VDLSLGYKPNAGNWDLQAYVRNVTNKAYFVDAEEVYPGAGSRLYSYAAPRTFGLRVSASFK
jgi:outer membrane receptor protein involved in Fe transport